MKSVDDAFIALLSGLRVGEGMMPAGGGWQGGHGTSPFRNYVMVVIGTGLTDGSITTLDDQVERENTTTCVSNTPEGCRILQEQVRSKLRQRRITTATRTTTAPITCVRVGPVERDDTVQPPVWIAVDVWRVDTVPL